MIKLQWQPFLRTWPPNVRHIPTYPSVYNRSRMNALSFIIVQIKFYRLGRPSRVVLHHITRSFDLCGDYRQDSHLVGPCLRCQSEREPHCLDGTVSRLSFDFTRWSRSAVQIDNFMLKRPSLALSPISPRRWSTVLCARFRGAFAALVVALFNQPGIRLAIAKHHPVAFCIL